MTKRSIQRRVQRLRELLKQRRQNTPVPLDLDEETIERLEEWDGRNDPDEPMPADLAAEIREGDMERLDRVESGRWW